MSVDISNLSIVELNKLKGNIDNVIANRRTSELSKLKAKIDALLSESGFSLEEVMQAKSEKKRIVPAKYKNPDDETQTWSGRGRKPNWVENLLEKGDSLESCSI